jgi:copper transport protein
VISARRAWAFAPAALAGAALTLVHAELLRTDPAADVVLEAAPGEVRLYFSEEVRPAPDPVVVVDPQGRRVDSGAGVSPDDRTQLRASVADGGPGTYVVRWRALSEDGHVIEGGYNYSVGQESTPAALEAAGADSGGGQQRLLVLGRALHLVGLTLALGALSSGLLIGPAPPATARSIALVGVPGAVLLVIASPVMLFAQGAAAAGSLSAGFSGSALAAVFGTPFGGLWVTRSVAALGLAATAFLALRATAPSRALVVVALVLGAVLLGATSANGHALTTDPVWLSVFLDSVHLAATAAWLGGGVCLAVLVRAGRRADGDQAALVDALARVTPRFSALALACVQILVVTGLYQTWAHVSGPTLLTSTDYGRALLVKLGLFTLIAAPAGINRFVMKPRLARAAAITVPERSALASRFGRLLGLEGALGALVLATAAWLTTLPPAEAVAAPPMVAEDPMTGMDHSAHMAPAAPVVPARLWSARAGDRTVVLSLDPGLIGSNQTRVTVRAADGSLVMPSAVALRTVPPAASGIRPSLVRLAQEGDTHAAVLGLGSEGEWALELLLDDERVATFRVTVTGQTGASSEVEP